MKPIKLKVHVTKEVLEATKMCGIEGSNFKLPGNNSDKSAYNCAITYACRKLFSNCGTGTEHIFMHKQEDGITKEVSIAILPEEAEDFIYEFDIMSPENRVKIEPFSFTIELLPRALEFITIDDITEVLKDSKTLSLVES